MSNGPYNLGKREQLFSILQMSVFLCLCVCVCILYYNYFHFYHYWYTQVLVTTNFLQKLFPSLHHQVSHFSLVNHFCTNTTSAQIRNLQKEEMYQLSRFQNTNDNLPIEQKEISKHDNPLPVKRRLWQVSLLHLQ